MKPRLTARIRAFPKRLWAGLVARYFTVDPRASGVFRIVFGVFLVLDCLRHWSEIDFLYSNQGVLTNHFHLFKPTSGNGLSIFHAFSNSSEVHVLFALGLVCHLFFLVGYRTRTFAILSLIWVVSRDTRIPFVENGGYVVQNLACFWGCFLPLGQRFSVDAWLRSLEARKERSIDDLNLTDDPSGARKPVVSMIGLIIIVNLAIVYLFNVINKMGHLWRNGTAVHYVLHLDRMVTGVAVFLRETLPSPLISAADFGTLTVEALIFVLIASWRARFYTRPLAIVLMTALHTTFGVFMRLGPFSWALICWSLLLLLPVHFERARRFYERRSVASDLLVDVRDPFALFLGRVVRRLDPVGRILIEAAPEGTRFAVRRGEEISSDPRDVYLQLTEGMPFGRWLRKLAAVLSLGLVPFVVKATLARGPAVARLFGLGRRAKEKPATSPLVHRLLKPVRVVREGALVWLAFCALIQLYMENKLIPKTIPPPLKPDQVLQPDEKWAYDLVKKYLGDEVITIKPDPPEIVSMTIGYPRAFQGWGMFAPNPIQEDGILTIDAVTIDGRRFDPFTGDAPILDLRPVRGAGLSQLRQDYGNRIRLDRNTAYRDGLKEHLLGYHLRTGNPKDEIIAFDVYWVRDKCPKPPSNEPYDNDAVPLLSYRRPKLDQLTKELGIQIAPAPKVRSAEKW